MSLVHLRMLLALTFVGVGSILLLLGGWWIHREIAGYASLPRSDLFQATMLILGVLTLCAAMGALYYAWKAQRQPKIILTVNDAVLYPGNRTDVPIRLEGRRATFEVKIENAADVTAILPRLHFTAEPSFPIDAPGSRTNRIPRLGNSYFWVQAEDLYPRRKSHGTLSVIADIPETVSTPKLFIMVNAQNYPDAIEKYVSWPMPPVSKGGERP